MFDFVFLDTGMVMFSHSLRRLAHLEPIVGPLTAKNNPYKAKKIWPPDFEKVAPKHQFRFERKYRRRAKMKYTHEKWNDGVKIFTWVGVTGMLLRTRVDNIY